jgi:flagellar basal-body rod protein FlgF
MAHANARSVSQAQGPLATTGGTLDFAIEGEGYFQIETPQGNRLTRAGNFTASPEGELVTSDGYRLLDVGGAPILLPLDGSAVTLSKDGTLSAGETPISQIGIFQPANSADLVHEGGTRLLFSEPLEPVEDAVLLQGFLEESNVDAVSEISRMIEVQRAYEMGQAFLDREDERIRSTISTLTR